MGNMRTASALRADTDASMDTQEMLKDATAFAAKHFPGMDAKSLKIEFRKGWSVSVEMPKLTFADKHDGLKENEMLLFNLLPENDKPGMTAAAIMNKAGYRSKSHFYAVLRVLWKKQLIDKDVAKGYRKRI
jgi:hypothetical protein